MNIKLTLLLLLDKLKHYYKKSSHNPWFFICVFLGGLTITVWKQGEQKANYVLEVQSYIHKEVTIHAIISERDRMLKYTDFYSKVLFWYGKKPQSKKAMSKPIRSKFVRMCYKYERKLDIPHAYFISKALLETYFNPFADNGIEYGIFQHRVEAVGQAKMFLDILRVQSPGTAAEMEFKFSSVEDLKDPLNALKIQALLAWGLKRMFKDEVVWWVSASHWGIGRVYKLWARGIEPPDEFVFNKGTIKEDVRNPLTYYFVWAGVHNAFINFRKDIFVDEGYMKAYIKQCSKLESQYLESWKYIQTMLKTAEVYEQRLKDIEKEVAKVKKEKLKYKSLLAKADLEYKKIYGTLRGGKFKHFKDVLRPAKYHFKEMVDELTKAKQTWYSRAIIIVYFIVIAIGLCYMIYGFVTSDIKIVKWIIRKIQRHNPPPPPRG